MTPTELLRLSDLNLTEAIREKARFCGGQVIETNGVMRALSATRMPVGPFNCAVLTQARTTDLLPLIAELRSFYAAHDRGFTMQICGERDRELEAACKAAGLLQASNSPGMVLDAPLAELSLPPGVSLEVVTHASQMAALTEVEARAYAERGMHAQVVTKVFGDPERMLAPHWHHVVAYLDGKPGAAAMALLSHGIAGIYWVGTVPEARKRGLGELVTRRVSNWAFAQGARAVVLQASEMGEPVYRRMGYRVFSRYPWYVATLR